MDRSPPRLRPAHVFAKPAAGDEVRIVASLQGSRRFALRLVVVWLSPRGLTPLDAPAERTRAALG